MVHLFLLVQQSLSQLGVPIWMEATTKTQLYSIHGVSPTCGRKMAEVLNTISLVRRQSTWLLDTANTLGTICLLFSYQALSLTDRFPSSPGRFFAVNELKTMLVHVLLNYDVKFEDGNHLPDNVWHATSIMPDPSINLLFRKRRH